MKKRFPFEITHYRLSRGLDSPVRLLVASDLHGAPFEASSRLLPAAMNII